MVTKSKSAGSRRLRRRGAVAVQVLMSLTLLLGAAALTIDLGTLYQARVDLQRAADSAALAAASAYTSEAMMRVRSGSADAGAFDDVLILAQSRADSFANINFTLNAPTFLEASGILTGRINAESVYDPIDPGAYPAQHNAAGVVVRRESDAGINGPVPFVFAPIFGTFVGNASASAVAIFDDRFASFDITANGAPTVLPMTVHEDVFAEHLANGGDDFGYDGDLSTVTYGPDGIREINLFPHDEAAGNFGLLNIGTPNQGTPALREQIENGVWASDMEAEVGTSLLTFFDDAGNPVTYEISGGTGLRAALESSLESRVGDLVAFFLHDDVTDTGSNAVFQIVSMRFGRVMEVELSGPEDQQGLWIQPVIYDGAGITITITAPGSDGLVGRLVLAR